MKRGRACLVVVLAVVAATAALVKRNRDIQAVRHWGETCRDAQVQVDANASLLSPEESSRFRAAIAERCPSGDAAQTPGALARERAEQLRRIVVVPVAGIRKARDTAVRNEWYLKARLMKPAGAGGVANSSDLEGMPEEFSRLVPRLTPELEFLLRKVSGEDAFEPRLYNSLGAGLGKARLDLEHIVDAADTSPATKAEAEALYSLAWRDYAGVKDRNDKLTWYRSGRDDRGMTTDERKNLVAAQAEVIGLIAGGDEAVRKLRACFDELHEQHYTKVIRQFWEQRVETYGPRDDQRVERFWDYYLTREKVAPGGSVSERVYSGTVKSDDDQVRRSWQYRDDEAVGYTVWKPLHRSNKEIRRGVNLDPRIVPLGETCVR